MKLFTCPFETRRCGNNPLVQVPSSGSTKTIQSRGFNKNDVCYYWVEAFQNVNQGDFIYVKFTSLSQVQTFVSLKTSIDDEDVICAVQGGDILLVRHPMKMYISFTSEDINAKFFINAYYSQSLTADAYVNHSVCSDGGASLGDVHSQSSSNSNSSPGGGVLENIKIVVAPRD